MFLPYGKSESKKITRLCMEKINITKITERLITIGRSNQLPQFSY